MPNNSVSIQPDPLNSLQQEYDTTHTFTSQIKHMIFDCNPVKMTVMTQFVLLILAIFLLNLGHITKVYAHGDHTTNTHPTVYVYGFRDYNLRENSIPFDFVSVGFVRSQVDEDLTTTIRYRVYAADGLTPETDLSTKNQDGTVTGTIRTLDITDQRTTASLRIDVTKDAIDEIYEDLDPDPMRNEKRTLAIELLESDSYHLAGSADADQTLSCTHQNGEDPGPRCTTVYFSIVDDDVPLIEIEKKSATGAISESSDWQFKLTSDITPAEEITVPFTVTINNPSPDSGNFFISTLPNQVQFSQNLNCGSNPPCEKTFDIVNQNHVMDSFNGNASFTVTLSAVASGNVGKYRIHEGANASKNSVSIEISDDLVSPTLSIAGVADSITEGNSAWFLITSSAEPTANLTINIDVTDSQSHLKTTAPATITLKAGETQVYLQLPTKTNGMNNSGSIAVEIETGTRYLVANSPNHSDSITINDIGPLVTFTDVSPGITFTTPNAFGYRVTEGTTVEVEITATPAPQNDLTIPIAIRDGLSTERPHGAGSNFLGEHLPDTVTIRAGQSTATFQFETLDDDEHTFQGTNDGSRVVAVVFLQQPGSGFEATYTDSLDINIIDNDPMPVVSIHANTDSIVEGETIRYRVSLSTKSAFTLGINVQMTTNGLYLASNFTHRVVIHAGLLKEFFEVATQHNNDDPASGTVTATIQSSFFYTTAAAPLNKAVVAVTDRPNLALISTRDPSVTEGTNIRFEITMTHNLTKDIKIPFVVTDGVTSNYGDMETEYAKGFRETFEAEGVVEDYLGENLVIEVMGNQGEKRIEFLVPTIDDDLDEPNGRIAYSLHPIIDPEYEIVFYEAGQISKVQVTDNDATPELSIAAVTSSVLEGGIAQYRISTPNKSAKDLEIGVSVTETETSTAANTYFMDTAPTTVTLKAGTTEVILNVPTRAVPDGPDNQQIMVELQAGTGYDVKSTADDASISVTEATNTVTLATPSGTEGDEIVFMVSIPTTLSNEDLTVNFVMSEEANVMVFTAENTGKVGDIFAVRPVGTATITSGNTSAEFRVRTTENDFDNPDRMLSYKVFHETGPEFEISGTAVGNLTLFDNDLPPVISIAAVSNSINEGDVAQYRVTSVGSSESDLDISLNIRDIGDFIDSTIPTSTTLEAKSTETILELQTNSDEVGDETGSIIVTVLDGTGYSVSTTASDSATIQVMSAGPLISISRVESVTEGSSIVLNLSASPTPTSNFSIPVFISDGVTSTFAENKILGLGNVLGSNLPTMANFTSGTSMTTVQIPTAGDDLDEPTNAGIVYIEFQRSTNAVYDLGKNFPISVIVLDNDDPPTISISAVKTTILEGEVAEFKISSNKVSGIDLEINLTIAETESFIDKFFVPESIPLMSGSMEHVFDIKTRSDSTEETNGTITVTLATGMNYNVANTPNNNAQVEVDDDPRIALAWSGDHNGVITSRQVTTSYDNLFGTVTTINMPSNSTFRANVAVADASFTSNITYEFTAASTQSGFKTGMNVSAIKYGSWHLSNDGTQILFIPKLTDINDLSQGESATSTLTLIIWGLNNQSLVNAKLVVRINRPNSSNATISWETGQSGEIIARETTTSYRDILGSPYEIVRTANTNLSTMYSTGEQKNNSQQTSGDSTLHATFENYSQVRSLGGNFDFGTWYVLTTSNDFFYRPDSTAINNLKFGDTVVSTLTFHVTETKINEPEIIIAEIYLSITVTITNMIVPTISLAWSGDHNGEITSREAITFHNNLPGTVTTTNKRSSSTFRADVAESGPTNYSFNVSHNFTTASTYSGYNTGSDLSGFKFGSWHLSEDGSQILFVPKNDAINSLNQGENATSTLVLHIWSSDNQSVVNATLSVQINRLAKTSSELTLAWDTGLDTTIETDGSFQIFEDLTGTFTSTNLPTNPIYSASATETKIGAQIFTDYVGTENIDAGYTALQFGENFQYGSWFFDSNNQRILFRINPTNFSRLDIGESVESTINVSLSDGDATTNRFLVSDSLTVTINAVAPTHNLPIVSISSPNSSADFGASVQLTVATSSDIEQNLEVQLNFNQTDSINLWRIPKSITLEPTQKSKQITLQTRVPELTDDTTLHSITVSIAANENYRIQSNLQNVKIVFNPIDTSPNNQQDGSRISVARSVVNSILTLLESEQSGEREFSSVADLEPEVKVQAESSEVEEGNSIELIVLANKKIGENLLVNIQIEGGDGVLLEPIPSSIQLVANQMRYILKLETIDDEIPGVDRLVSVRLIEGVGYSVSKFANQVTLVISDARDRAIYRERLAAANSILIPELMAATGVRSYQTMANRVQMAFDSEEPFAFEVGGHSNPTEILKLSGQTLNEQIDLMDMLRDDTAIAIKLTSDHSILNNTTAWLKSENQNVYNLNNFDSTAWSGDFYTGNFGIDTQLNSGLLLGVATSISEHEINLSIEQTQEFQYSSSYTGFNPYIALNLPALNTEVWVSSNFSSGYIDVDSEHQQTHRLASQFSTMSFGAESQLFSHDDSILNGTSELNLTSQGWIAQQNIFGDGRFTSDLTTTGHNLKLAFEGSHEFDISKIGTFNPNMLFGIRQANKDSNTVTGIEFGIGTHYSSNFGLTFEGTSRGFKAGDQQDFTTSIAGELSYNPNQDNTGPKFTISPSWSHSAQNSQLTLWQSNLTEENNLFNHYNNGKQIKTEYSYGLKLLDKTGILTPFAALDFREGDNETLGGGIKLSIGSNLNFKFKGSFDSTGQVSQPISQIETNFNYQW